MVKSTLDEIAVAWLYYVRVKEALPINRIAYQERHEQWRRIAVAVRTRRTVVRRHAGRDAWPRRGGRVHGRSQCQWPVYKRPRISHRRGRGDWLSADFPCDEQYWNDKMASHRTCRYKSQTSCFPRVHINSLPKLFCWQRRPHRSR